MKEVMPIEISLICYGVAAVLFSWAIYILQDAWTSFYQYYIRYDDPEDAPKVS